MRWIYKGRLLAITTAAILSGTGGGAVFASSTQDQLAAGDHTGRVVHAAVIGADGHRIGTVRLQETQTGVLVIADVTGLPAGEHGFHFHQKGICDPGSNFASAGGHFQGMHDHHGLMVPGGPHAGDMPNQYVGSDGRLRAEVLNSAVTLAPGRQSLFDADGTALVIHAGADDYVSQPSGDAGARIACAVVAAPE